MATKEPAVMRRLDEAVREIEEEIEVLLYDIQEHQDAFKDLRNEVLRSNGPLDINNVLDLIDTYWPKR